jgi:hypothetical protein
VLGGHKAHQFGKILADDRGRAIVASNALALEIALFDMLQKTYT